MLLPRENYQKTVKRDYPPLLAGLVLKGITKEEVYNGVFSVPFSRKDSVICDGVWYNNKNVEDFGRKLISEEWVNKDILDRFIKLCRERERFLIESTKNNFEDFVLAFENYMVSLTLVFLAEEPFSQKLKKELSRYLLGEELDALLSDLSIPFEDNYHRIEEFDLASGEDLISHAEKYKWFLSRNGENITYDINNIKNKLLNFDKDKFLEDYRLQKNKIKESVEKAKKLIGNEYSYLVDGLQFIVFYRTHRTDVLNRAFFLFIPKLIKVAEGFGISYEDLIFCLPKEILDKKIPDIKVINQRKKGYAILVQDGVPKCFEGVEFLRIKSHLEGEIIFSGNINGAVAYKGVVSGEVFLVNESNFNDIKEGAVLVTSMTVPSMLPAMKIASAFITDEGGITCHASIIARELKKPCIIGTKIATKVLKDGDFVEVNANEGVVRIIK